MERDYSAPSTGRMAQSDPTADVGSQPNSGTMAEQAKHAVANVASQATEQASQRVESGITRGKDRTARALGAVAQSLRSVGNELRDQDEGGISRFVDRAADRADEMVNRLNNADPNTLIDDIEAFARREPAMFIGGAIAIGIVAARFLKSSRRGDERSTPSAPPTARMNATVPAERDVTDSLVHRDAIPTPGSAGQPTL